MGFSTNFRSSLVLLFVFLLSSPAFGSESASVRLRSSHACGLYLSSLVDDSEGKFRASLDPEEIENYLRSSQAREDLKPALAFRDKGTGKVIRDSEALRKALEEDQAVPVINKKTLNLVGVSLTGKERRYLSRLVKALVHEQLADLEVRIRVLGRPEQAGLYLETEKGWVKVADADRSSIEEYFSNLKEGGSAHSYRLSGLKFRERFPIFDKFLSWTLPFYKSRSSDTLSYARSEIEEQRNGSLQLGWERPWTYGFHRLVYFFPLHQDFQQPTRQEISAGKAKLTVNTPISILGLIIADNPANIVIPVSFVNFSQSALTAAYSVVLSNWFSRSHRDAHFERLAKNAFLSAIFTTPIYWVGRGSWEGFRAIATFAGWGNFIFKKWSTVAFNVLWRFFVSNGTYKWEQTEIERADRLKREDFESEEAFLEAKREIRDRARATRSRIEALASSFGTVGYLLAAAMPINFVPEFLGGNYFEFGWGHLIMTSLGGIGAMIYFQPSLIDRTNVPQRLESFHEKITQYANGIKNSGPVHFFRNRWSALQNKITEQKAELGRSLLEAQDIEEVLEFDESVRQMISEDPELKDLIRENVRVQALIGSLSE